MSEHMTNLSADIVSSPVWPKYDHEFKLQFKGLSNSVICEAWRFLYFNDNYKSLYIHEYDISMAVENSKAKPATALSKWLYDTKQVKLTPEDKAKLGNLLKVDTFDYTIAITYGCDGDAEDYYHESSCWWGGESQSRDWLESNGGGAVRAYDTAGEVVGRVWFIPYENGIVLFNSYGKGELQHTSAWKRILTQGLNLEACPVDFHFRPSGMMYINSHTSFFVGKFEDPYSSIYIHLDSPSIYKYENDSCVCEICGNHMHEDDSYYIENEYITVCEHCLSNHFVYAYTGHRGYREYLREEDCTQYSGEWYSNEHSSIIFCEEDSEYHHEDEVTVLESGYTVLYSNRSDTWQQCEKCGSCLEIDELEEIDGDWYCTDCVPEIEDESEEI